MRTGSGEFDVIVLGAGYAGSLAATVLVRKGYRVALLDRGPVPRFTVGESTTTDQNRCHTWFGRQLVIPELTALDSYARIKRNRVPVPVWPKESFYFLDESAQRELLLQTVAWPVGPDYHCVRADYDLHLLSIAQRYGATFLGNAEVKDVELDSSVRCRLVGEGVPVEIEGRFLVDASGPGAFLARQRGSLDRDPEDMSLRSRAIYSQFIGVRSLEGGCAGRRKTLRLSRDDATQHYFWEGGWIWVIPFDNGVTSVGVVLNMEREDEAMRQEPPEEIFWSAVERNPALCAMMADAKPLRPLLATGRLQWQARGPLVGDNFAILPPASGFTDPFLSPGLASSAVAVGRLSDGIDAVLRDGRPGVEALSLVESGWRSEYEYVSRLQHLVFRSFHSFDLFREMMTVYRLAVVYYGVDIARRGEAPWGQLLWGFDSQALRSLVDRLHALLPTQAAKGEEGEALLRSVRRTLAEGDRFGFLDSVYNRPADPDIHLNELLPLYRFVRGLSRSEDPQIAGRDLRRQGWLRNLWGAGFRALSERLGLFGSAGRFAFRPRRHGLLRLAVRQLRLQLSRFG